MRPSRRTVFIGLLIVLVLIAGAGAIVAIRLTAPDAPGGGAALQELADRARARLEEWGLLEP